MHAFTRGGILIRKTSLRLSVTLSLLLSKPVRVHSTKARRELWCVWVWSRILDTEEALTHWGLLRQGGKTMLLVMLMADANTLLHLASSSGLNLLYPHIKYFIFPQYRFIIVLALLFSFQMYIEISILVAKRLWLTSARRVWFHLWTQINDLFIGYIRQNFIWVRNLKYHQILFEFGIVLKIQVSWFDFLGFSSSYLWVRCNMLHSVLKLLLSPKYRGLLYWNWML
jgi:hypothetical protein